jgi:hypothetical protein
VKHFSVSIETENSAFNVENHFLLNMAKTTIVRYLGSASSIVIPRGVETLGSQCFSSCKSLSSISFESNSQLKRIESSAFSGT